MIIVHSTLVRLVADLCACGASVLDERSEITTLVEHVDKPSSPRPLSLMCRPCLAAVSSNKLPSPYALHGSPVQSCHGVTRPAHSATGRPELSTWLGASSVWACPLAAALPAPASLG